MMPSIFSFLVLITILLGCATKQDSVTVQWKVPTQELRADANNLQYRIYHGQNRNQYDSCLKNLKSPIELPASALIQKDGFFVYQIPKYEFTGGQCYLNLSSVNKTGEIRSDEVIDIHLQSKEKTQL